MGTEKKKTAPKQVDEKVGGPSVFDEKPLSPKGGAPNVVTVTHGLYSHALPVVGMTVSQVKAKFRDLLDIDPEAVAVMDGIDVDESSIVKEGSFLLFVKRAAEKGAL